MSYRFMRVMVFFDLPMVTLAERREYRRFRKYLLTAGFIMMQESVYSKLILNTSAAKTVMENVRTNKPIKGLVQLLLVTERQYENIELIVGEEHNEVVNSPERLVIL